MPNLFLADMVRELSSSTGTGAFVLDGAAPGHRAFASVVPPAATFPYAICGVSDESQWETGEGALSPTGALLRTPKASSAGGALVDFGAGLKTVALTLTADWAGAVAAEAAGPVALAAVTGLTQALAGKQNQLSASPSTSVIAAQDGIAITRNGQSLNATGGAVLARRTADGPYVAEGTIQIAGNHSSTALKLESSVPAYPHLGTTMRVIASIPGITYGGGAVTFNLTTGLSGIAQPLMGSSCLHFAENGTFSVRTGVAGAGDPVARLVIAAGGAYMSPGTDNLTALGGASFRWTALYSSSGSINTSDERQKTDIGAIPDEWLDAWGDVAWSRYRFKDGRRWHVGLVAQRVYAAFEARGLDAFTIGLCCYDQWHEVRAPILDEAGQVTGEGDIMTEAGDLWGLRYDECFAMEAAWVRRELSRLQAGKSDKRSHRRVA